MPSVPADGLSGRDLVCYRRNWRAVCRQYPPMDWAEEILCVTEETGEPHAVSTRRWTERKRSCVLQKKLASRMPSVPADGLSGRDLVCYRRNWRAACHQYPPMDWAEEILCVIEKTGEPHAVSTRRWTERKCKRATGALMCRMPSMPTKGQRRSGHMEDTCKRTTSLEQPINSTLDCTLQRGTLEPHS